MASTRHWNICFPGRIITTFITTALSDFLYFFGQITKWLNFCWQVITGPKLLSAVICQFLIEVFTMNLANSSNVNVYEESMSGILCHSIILQHITAGKPDIIHIIKKQPFPGTQRQYSSVGPIPLNIYCTSHIIFSYQQIPSGTWHLWTQMITKLDSLSKLELQDDNDWNKSNQLLGI